MCGEIKLFLEPKQQVLIFCRMHGMKTVKNIITGGGGRAGGGMEWWTK